METLQEGGRHTEKHFNTGTATLNDAALSKKLETEKNHDHPVRRLRQHGPHG